MQQVLALKADQKQRALRVLLAIMLTTMALATVFVVKFCEFAAIVVTPVLLGQVVSTSFLIAAPIAVYGMWTDARALTLKRAFVTDEVTGLSTVEHMELVVS